MDLTLLEESILTISSVGIEELVIEPCEEDDQKTRFRGANKERSVVVYDSKDFSLTDVPMGILSVKALLSRISLFDVSKAKAETEKNNDVISKISLKQGRKKANYQCSDPSYLQVPKKIPGNLESDNKIVLNKEMVDHISQAVASMSLTGSKEERYISISVSDNTMTVTISDGESDAFTDVVSLDATIEDVAKASWDVVSFQRVMKKASELSEDHSASFHITEHGVIVFVVGNFNIIVVPMA